MVEIVWFECWAQGEFPPVSALHTVECPGCVWGVITCACSFFHPHGAPDGRQEGCKGRGRPTLRSLFRSVQRCLLCAQEARALEERKMRPVQTPDLPPNASCQGGRDRRSPSSQKDTAFLLFF